MTTTWEEKVAADEAAANAAMEEMLSDARLIAEFGLWYERAKTTRHKYTRCVREFAEFLAGCYVTPGLVRAGRWDVVRFMHWLDGDEEAAPLVVPGSPEFGHVPARVPLSASSRKGYLSALRSFYYFCLDSHFIHHDPTAGVRAPKVTHTQGLTLTADELQLFLDAPGSERDRIQAYLLVFTAQRAGALRMLRWQDVDLDNQEARFYGKGDKENVLHLHPELFGSLSRWKRKQREGANSLVAAALDDDERAYVLLTRAGRQVTVQTLGKQAKWRAARCGLRLHTSGDMYHENKSQVHPHAFRRSWATLQRRRGVALEDIADVLAHASTDTTRKHYAFPPSDAKRKTITSFSL